MAERRMFAKTIVLSDVFLDMPMSARCLYFTLGMLADDDGFVGNPKSIMRQCGATDDDIKILLAKRYVLGFESGVIVIKHWKMNNYLQSDRHKSTTYLDELRSLTIDEKGAYTELEKDSNNSMYTNCIQNVYTGKDRLVKDSIGKYRLDYKDDDYIKKRVTCAIENQKARIIEAMESSTIASLAEDKLIDLLSEFEINEAVPDSKIEKWYGMIVEYLDDDSPKSKSIGNLEGYLSTTIKNDLFKCKE